MKIKIKTFWEFDDASHFNNPFLLPTMSSATET